MLSIILIFFSVSIFLAKNHFIENSNKFDLSVVGKDLSSGWQSKKISEYISVNSKSSVLYIPN